MTRQLTIAGSALVLLFCLPLLGVGGRALAGFNTGSAETHEGADWKALLADFMVDADASSTTAPAKPDVAPMNEPTPSSNPSRQAEPATTGGAGSSGPAGAGVGGTVSVGCLDPHLDLSVDTRGGRLFLAEQRYRPYPLASRLFRPPRFDH